MCCSKLGSSTRGNIPHPSIQSTKAANNPYIESRNGRRQIHGIGVDGKVLGKDCFVPVGDVALSGKD